MEGLEKRIIVLEYSLQLEKFVTCELALLLEIIDYKSTKSLGNGSSSLSINQKLNLLMDVKNISSNEKATIENFMSIRNQFMHNIDACSYSYVIERINGLGNKLKKQYPKYFTYEADIEEIYELCIHNLYTDSLKILMQQKGSKFQKKMKLIAQKSDEIIKGNLQESIDKNIAILESFIENHPDNTIEKNLILTKVISMNISIMLETNETVIN